MIIAMSAMLAACGAPPPVPATAPSWVSGTQSPGRTAEPWLVTQSGLGPIMLGASFDELVAAGTGGFEEVPGPEACPVMFSSLGSAALVVSDGWSQDHTVHGVYLADWTDDSEAVCTASGACLGDDLATIESKEPGGGTQTGDSFATESGRMEYYVVTMGDVPVAFGAGDDGRAPYLAVGDSELPLEFCG